MAFRAGEEIKAGTEHAIQYLTPRDGTPEQKKRARELVLSLIERFGPRVRSYPSWHPIVSQVKPTRGWGFTTPCPDNGYSGLDHTVTLANAIITCPYNDGSAVFESIDRFNSSRILDGSFHAETLNTPLYHTSTTPILIRFNWHYALEENNTIPSKVAIPLMLLDEVPNWRWAECPEAWDSMRAHLLGEPCGSRSSLFVSQETGQAMKSIWNSLVKAGVFS